MDFWAQFEHRKLCIFSAQVVGFLDVRSSILGTYLKAKANETEPCMARISCVFRFKTAVAAMGTTTAHQI